MPAFSIKRVDMIKYTTNPDILDSLNLDGFFIGWINPPSNVVLKKY